MRGLWWVLMGVVILIQSPEFGTKTLQVEKVAEDTYFVITELGSATVQIIDTDEEDVEWETKDTE